LVKSKKGRERLCGEKVGVEIGCSAGGKQPIPPASLRGKAQSLEGEKKQISTSCRQTSLREPGIQTTAGYLGREGLPPICEKKASSGSKKKRRSTRRKKGWLQIGHDGNRQRVKKSFQSQII